MSSWIAFTHKRFGSARTRTSGTPHEPGRRIPNLALQSAHSVHFTECADCKSTLAARSQPRAGDPQICAASERRRQSIITCERRRRTNVLSAWNVVPSSAATGLSPAVHSPSRTMDLQSPQRTSVETCRQTSHGEHDVENRSLRLREERDHHAGRPSCDGHGLIRPMPLPVTRPVIHAHRGEHHRSG